MYLFANEPNLASARKRLVISGKAPMKPLTSARRGEPLPYTTGIGKLHLRKLFSMTRNAASVCGRSGGPLSGLFEDRITAETLGFLFNWPMNPVCGARMDAMFRGEKINVTEDRAVLHVALRAPRTNPYLWTARTSCRRSTRFSIRCRVSQAASGAARGRAIRASVSKNVINGRHWRVPTSAL